MFNCSFSNAPAYLTELLSTPISKRYLRSSASSIGCFNVPFNKKRTFSDRSFSTVGPKLWNNLPFSLSLRQCSSIDTFKKQLFRSLFCIILVACLMGLVHSHAPGDLERHGKLELGMTRWQHIQWSIKCD